MSFMGFITLWNYTCNVKFSEERICNFHEILKRSYDSHKIKNHSYEEPINNWTMGMGCQGIPDKATFIHLKFQRDLGTSVYIRYISIMYLNILKRYWTGRWGMGLHSYLIKSYYVPDDSSKDVSSPSTRSRLFLDQSEEVWEHLPFPGQLCKNASMESTTWKRIHKYSFNNHPW